MSRYWDGTVCLKRWAGLVSPVMPSASADTYHVCYLPVGHPGPCMCRCGAERGPYDERG